MNDLRYPIGKLQRVENVTPELRVECIQNIAETPAKLKAAVAGMTEEQLNTPYREGGWTVRQLVHHLPDSHLNAYVRFKLTLTEETPAIKTYEEHLWAELLDARTAPVEPSLQLLESLHFRWVMLLRSMTAADFMRKFNHPENGILPLDNLLQIYSWHGRHHVAHITSLKDRMGW